jgi:hypothetical protein
VVSYIILSHQLPFSDVGCILLLCRRGYQGDGDHDQRIRSFDMWVITFSPLRPNILAKCRVTTAILFEDVSPSLRNLLTDLRDKALPPQTNALGDLSKLTAGPKPPEVPLPYAAPPIDREAKSKLDSPVLLYGTFASGDVLECSGLW